MTDDPEVRLIGGIVAAFRTFDKRTQLRVLDYVQALTLDQMIGTQAEQFSALLDAEYGAKPKHTALQSAMVSIPPKKLKLPQR